MKRIEGLRRFLIIVWSIALVACGTSGGGSQSPSLPAATPEFTKSVTVRTDTGSLISGCSVKWGESDRFTGTTNLVSAVSWQVPAHIKTGILTLKCEGYLDYAQDIVTDDANQTIVIGGGDPVGSNDLRLPAPHRPHPTAVARHGIVRRVGNVLADDDGEFNPLGVSLFWSTWGYRNDRAKLERNFQAIADKKIYDYHRTFAVVGPGGGWDDRTVDPNDSGIAEQLAGAIDLAYDRFGLRTQITVFAGIDLVPTAAARRAVMATVIEVVKPRRHKIFLVEPANEGWQNGFGGADGIAELRALARQFHDAVPDVLYSLTAPDENNPAGACELYGGWDGPIAVLHYQRGRGDVVNGLSFRPVRQPWGWGNGEYEEKGHCPGQLSQIRAVNNEPIAPFSSVEMEKDPRLIASAYRTTFIAGNVAYLYHSGAGIRGGARIEVNPRPEEMRPYLPRPANVWEEPQWESVSAALAVAKRAMPLGAAGWARHNAQWTSAPIRDLHLGPIVRAMAIVRGDRFLVEVIGLGGPVIGRASEDMEIEVQHAATGEVLQRITAKKDGAVAINVGEPVVLLVGRFTRTATEVRH